jgi:prepilin-type N-terminal cleavage/methylation domain-containing protein
MHRAPVSPHRLPRPGRVPRAGFTLVELMMALVLLAMIGGAIVNLLTRQQRFYRSAQEAIDLRAELRHAGMLLPTDLRTISPANGDVYAWSDTMIEFRQILGSGVSCQIFSPVGATQRIALPPLRLARDGALTSWIAAPEPGDSLFVYDDGAFVGNADDVWRAYAIAAVATLPVTTGCTGAYYTSPDAGLLGYRLTLALPSGSTAIPLTVAEGAPIRIFRRARYSLFQQPSDGRWYLGFSDCLAGRVPACSTPLAVAGPYRPYSATDPGTTGLAFSYWDGNGAQLVPGVSAVAELARIDVVTRTETVRVVANGVGKTRYLDSLHASIGLRNR